MNSINRFFWFCSGVHRPTLEKYPAEHSKYTGIGATIFFTGLFAALSGGYALYFVFSGGEWAVLLSMLFGLLWGLAIFNMDRYIVLSINKNGSPFKQFLQASPRILLAILIGIVISRPLELKLFEKEIEEKLHTVYLERDRARLDTLSNAFDKKYAIEFGQLQELKARRDTLEAAIKSDRLKLKLETFGDKTPETSGITGYGPYARQREAELARQEQYLDTLHSRILRQEAFTAERKQFEGLMELKLLAGPQLDSVVNLAGFADRNAALGQLRFRADGTEDRATHMAILFIGLLFIFFECLPVLVKLMSSRDAYDVEIQNRQLIDYHRSDKGREAEIQVIDNLQETRIQTQTERQKTEDLFGSES